MADIELVKPHADGDFYHGTEFRNGWLADNTYGVKAHTLTATVTETDMDITLPAITARVPDGSGGVAEASYAGGTLTVSASDVTNPRIDIIVLDAAGAAAIRAGTPTDESGDVEEAPLPALEDDEILLARIRVEKGVTSILAEKVIGRAIDISNASPPVEPDIQAFIEAQEVEWSDVVAALAGVGGANEGVLPRYLDELAPSVNGSDIDIETGGAVSDGVPFILKAQDTITPATPTVGTTGRRLVIRTDWSAETITIEEISSTDGTATIPALTQTSGTTYEIPLCQYTVTTGGAIAAFVDEREFAGMSSFTDIFEASGTWTKRAGAKAVRVEMWGAGGGGRTGGGAAAGGGGGGAHKAKTFDADALGATETVTVGAGGSPGASGGSSSFGSHLTAPGGGGSSGANGGVGGGDGTAAAAPVGSEGGTAGTGGSSATAGSPAEHGGAGGGGGHNSTTDSGNGGSSTYGGGGGGGAGGSGSSQGAGGRTGTRTAGGGGAEGGGDGSAFGDGGGGAGFNQGDGGDGGKAGGGGGSWNGTAGSGGDGYVVVITYF